MESAETPAKSKDINIESPYALFTLFFSEECFQQISNSTNLYAKLKKENGDTDNEAPKFSDVEMEIETEKIIVETSSISTSIIQPREWKKINPAEIKVFIDLLLYMEVHKSQRTDLYWRNDLKQGSIHSIQSHMSHTRFQQLKRYIHISNPREARRPEAQNKDWWYKIITLHLLHYSNSYVKRDMAPAVLAELRDYTAAIPWNTLYAIEQEKVLCLAWQDNNMVLALSTIHSLDTFIERIRKRSGELSTNANIVRKVFEELPIGPGSLFFYWLIDSAAVDAYRLYYLYKKQQGVPKKDLPSHISFYEKLYQQLFEFAPKIHDNLPIE
ncbi:predicted protein [Histoplasma mississippiense (nom. inval.)]|uniref:predicted protein n=1 Tax=Ajellomyces capsulatus (strain NAm1 / WU24) TaxID=2059318 RepID=UPI000157C7DD|nr:predicted protein [Histoplasma mississippiense (nom. inval.)]EDN09364.1 predicted protein [Histoplasma mississippiense (nom. inval.)]